MGWIDSVLVALDICERGGMIGEKKWEKNDFQDGLPDERKMICSEPLATVSLSELYDTSYPPKTQIIEGLLSSGAYLFVGAPKIGKSFFVAQLGYHVSNGMPLWGYPVHSGTVLYLALEDDYSRLQKRLSRMFGTDSADQLHFATRSQSLGTGLDDQLNQFVLAHAGTRLIIIDTLQKVRDASGDRYSYANDYDIVTRLKHFAERFNLCILIVHHTRKQSSDDCFDTISGTNGLLGAADGAFLLMKEKRTDNRAILDVVGRDQQDQRLYLVFDREFCLWRLTKTETELWKEPVDPLHEAVASFLATQSCWSGNASELCECLGLALSPNVLTRRLNISTDDLMDRYGICFQSSRTHAGRHVTLSKMEQEA